MYKNIVCARNVSEKVKGREAKSDFNLVDSNGNDQIFISHKKAGGAKAFQQYGGVSKKAGEKIYNHPEVQNFLKVLTEYIENDKLIQPVYRKVKDINLIGLSVFGSEYDSNKFSIENVQVIGQGSPVLKSIKENLFELSFDDHLVYNTDVQVFTKGSYTAILGATFRAGRAFEVNGQKYKGARVGIYPIDMIKNRSNAIEV